MNVGSLFSGIGGFDLGLARAGMRVAWQCEANPYRRAVLALRFPGVPCYPDVRELDPAAVEPVDLVCGGFPCVDISNAGKRAGIEGPGSRLWAEMFRVVRGLRPRHVVVENVSALLGRGMGRVLGDLSSIGYDAEWDCLRAADFGAPHLRDRVWIVAYPEGDGRREGRTGRSLGAGEGQANEARPADLPNPLRSGLEGRGLRGSARNGSGEGHLADGCPQGFWSVEPDVGRVAHGVPSRVDRLSALGDSLVPQIAEWLGRRILDCEGL